MMGRSILRVVKLAADWSECVSVKAVMFISDLFDTIDIDSTMSHTRMNRYR